MRSDCKTKPIFKTQNHCKVNKKEADVLLSLFENRTYRQLALLYYVEGYTLEKCAELLFFSKRHIERMKKEIDKIAFFSLLNMVANSEKDLKLLEIKKIIMDGDFINEMPSSKQNK